jgi:hypothetical protein
MGKLRTPLAELVGLEHPAARTGMGGSRCAAGVRDR